MEAPRCKHGMIEGTCSLCLGWPQEGASGLYLGGGPGFIWTLQVDRRHKHDHRDLSQAMDDLMIHLHGKKR